MLSTGVLVWGEIEATDTMVVTAGSGSQVLRTVVREGLTAFPEDAHVRLFQILKQSSAGEGAEGVAANMDACGDGLGGVWSQEGRACRSCAFR